SLSRRKRDVLEELVLDDLVEKEVASFAVLDVRVLELTGEKIEDASFIEIRLASEGVLSRLHEEAHLPSTSGLSDWILIDNERLHYSVDLLDRVSGQAECVEDVEDVDAVVADPHLREGDVKVVPILEDDHNARVGQSLTRVSDHVLLLLFIDVGGESSEFLDVQENLLIALDDEVALGISLRLTTLIPLLRTQSIGS